MGDALAREGRSGRLPVADPETPRRLTLAQPLGSKPATDRLQQRAAGCSLWLIFRAQPLLGSGHNAFVALGNPDHQSPRPGITNLLGDNARFFCPITPVPRVGGNAGSGVWSDLMILGWGYQGM